MRKIKNNWKKLVKINNEYYEYLVIKYFYIKKIHQK